MTKVPTMPENTLIYCLFENCLSARTIFSKMRATAPSWMYQGSIIMLLNEMMEKMSVNLKVLRLLLWEVLFDATVSTYSVVQPLIFMSEKVCDHNKRYCRDA